LLCFPLELELELVQLRVAALRRAPLPAAPVLRQALAVLPRRQ
jgi:hypothetical protein